MPVIFGASALFMTYGVSADTLTTMKEELDRAFESLQSQEVPPYFLSYEITEDVTATVVGGFGEVTSESSGVSRYLDIDLRVGDYSLDNTHPRQGGGFGFNFEPPTPIAIENEEALKATLWYRTDAKYKAALTQFTNVQSDVQSTVEADDQSGDFSPAPASEYSMPKEELVADTTRWSEKIQQYTRPFAESEFVQDNTASINGDIETRWFVNSDGSKIMVSRPFYRMVIQATTKAEDGMVLNLVKTFEANTPEQLLDDEKVLLAVNTMINNLEALRVAPLVDPYTGPAILSGRASGVFFHEILGHRLEGHRQKGVDEGQTFRKQIGQKVLPETFSVIFDPNTSTYAGVELSGTYMYDNEGVRGQRVVAIENGILKGFLMSRSPIEGYPVSNGHGRKNYGNSVVARQSNLIVEVENAYSPEELEALLLERVREQGKEFGLYFDDITGGFTMTGRTMPNAFNVTPVMVYRIYSDGRKELVRGVDLIGTPLTTFSRIEAGATDFQVFNGMCGAESGWVPVSAVSPSILVSQIEVQKADSSRNIPPILPSPVSDPTDQSIRHHLGDH